MSKYFFTKDGREFIFTMNYNTCVVLQLVHVDFNTPYFEDYTPVNIGCSE